MTALVHEFGHGSLPRLRTHRNPGLEIVYISRGHLLWHTQGRIEPVPSQSVFFTLPEQEHGSAEEFEPGHEWTFVVLAQDRLSRRLLHPALGFSQKEAVEIESALRGAERHAFRATPGMKWVLPELVSELTNPGTLHEAKVAGLARAAVIELVRSVEAGQRVVQPGVLAATHNRVRAFIGHLAQHPEEPWTLARMAARCRLGRTQFARIFHEQTGDTPIQFVNRMRVRIACQQLRETDLSVTRIALDCGFGTSQYFAKVFKAYTGGMDARSYRKGGSGPGKAANGYPKSERL